jgi:hypothetical protein
MNRHPMQGREDDIAGHDSAVCALTKVDAGLPSFTPVDRFSRSCRTNPNHGLGNVRHGGRPCRDTGILPVRAMSARARRPCHAEHFSRSPLSQNELRPRASGAQPGATPCDLARRGATGSSNVRNEPNRSVDRAIRREASRFAQVSMRLEKCGTNPIFGIRLQLSAGPEVATRARARCGTMHVRSRRRARFPRFLHRRPRRYREPAAWRPQLKTGEQCTIRVTHRACPAALTKPSRR